jgi:hypothetical protein
MLAKYASQSKSKEASALREVGIKEKIILYLFFNLIIILKSIFY